MADEQAMIFDPTTEFPFGFGVVQVEGVDPLTQGDPKKTDVGTFYVAGLEKDARVVAVGLTQPILIRYVVSAGSQQFRRVYVELKPGEQIMRKKLPIAELPRDVPSDKQTVLTFEIRSADKQKTYAKGMITLRESADARADRRRSQEQWDRAQDAHPFD